MEKKRRLSREFLLMIGCTASSVIAALLFLANGEQLISPTMLISLVPAAIGIAYYRNIRGMKANYYKNLQNQFGGRNRSSKN